MPFGFLGQALGGLEGIGERLRTVGGAEMRSTDLRAARFHGALRGLEESSHPVLLGLDDLHWADSDSLALVLSARRLGGLPAAIIGTLRPWPPAARELATGLASEEAASLVQLCAPTVTHLGAPNNPGPVTAP